MKLRDSRLYLAMLPLSVDSVDNNSKSTNDNSDNHLLSTYYTLSLFVWIFFHLQNRHHYCPYFTDKKTEAWRT